MFSDKLVLFGICKVFQKRSMLFSDDSNMTELKGFSLYEVVINWDADARIDKYRAGHNSGTMLFPATLQDHGSPIEVVVKVSKYCTVPYLYKK